jgi:hypothetical protein
MSLGHLIAGLLESIPYFSFIFGSAACPRCGIEMRRLSKPNEEKIHRCPACEELWVRRDKKWHPFISRREQ